MRVSTTVLQNSFGKYLKQAIEGTPVYIEKNSEPVAVLKAVTEEERWHLREKSRAYMAHPRYTYEEFREIAERDDNTCQYEFIDGQIYLLGSPRVPHQKALGELHATFFQYFEDKPCRPFMAPLDVKLFGKAERFEDNPNVVQPDMFVMCDTDRVDEKGAYQGIPTLAVEILSPSTKSKDIMIKAKLYMDSGIQEYWVVDIEKQHLIIYHFEERDLKDQMTFTSGDSACSSIFEGLTIETTRLF